MADCRVSARRSARARSLTDLTVTRGGVPACLSLGPCVEVWADPRSTSPQISAWRRFGTARTWWLNTAGATRSEGYHLIPIYAPWSVDGRTELPNLASLTTQASKLHHQAERSI